MLYLPSVPLSSYNGGVGWLSERSCGLQTANSFQSNLYGEQSVCPGLRSTVEWPGFESRWPPSCCGITAMRHLGRNMQKALEWRPADIQHILILLFTVTSQLRRLRPTRKGAGPRPLGKPAVSAPRNIISAGEGCPLPHYPASEAVPQAAMEHGSRSQPRRDSSVWE